jgi:hypothetical protein
MPIVTALGSILGEDTGTEARLILNEGVALTHVNGVPAYNTHALKLEGKGSGPLGSYPISEQTADRVVAGGPCIVKGFGPGMAWTTEGTAKMTTNKHTHADTPPGSVVAGYLIGLQVNYTDPQTNMAMIGLSGRQVSFTDPLNAENGPGYLRFILQPA